jgi:hypothetical protein
MVRLVLRVRMMSGDQIDVSYHDPDADSDDGALEHVIATLAQESGVLRSSHGDRTVIIFGRGVAGFEVSPRGAVL